jgi:hypothetical protein
MAREWAPERALGPAPEPVQARVPVLALAQGLVRALALALGPQPGMAPSATAPRFHTLPRRERQARQMSGH